MRFATNDVTLESDEEDTPIEVQELQTESVTKPKWQGPLLDSDEEEAPVRPRRVMRIEEPQVNEGRRMPEFFDECENEDEQCALIDRMSGEKGSTWRFSKLPPKWRD